LIADFFHLPPVFKVVHLELQISQQFEEKKNQNGPNEILSGLEETAS
jgi:hypothetical protein